MAIRKVLKMIEQRETALAKRSVKTGFKAVTSESRHYADNAKEALRILGIPERDPAWGDANPRDKVALWIGQATLGSSGSRKLTPIDVNNIGLFVTDAARLKSHGGRPA